MKPNFVRGLPFLCLAVALTAQETAVQLDEKLGAAFAWLDTVDPIDTGAFRYVRLLTGGGGDADANDAAKPPPEVRGIQAFLLKDDGTTFVARGVDGETWTLRRRASEKRHLRVDWEPADLAAEATELANTIDAPGAGFGDDVEPRRTVPGAVRTILLARACARRGHVELANRLGTSTSRLSQGKAPLEIVQDDLPLGWWWQVVEAFGDPTVTREELLARCEHHARVFPELPWRNVFEPGPKVMEWRARFIDDLRSLIAEDAAREAASLPSNPESDAAIAHDIFELRNEFATGYDSLTPPDARSGVAAPWERLVARGLNAVPALIEAIVDSPPSRCASYFHRFGGSFSVGSIGGRARDAVEAILGLSLTVSDGDISASGGDWSRAAQSRARQAYDAIRLRCEENVLADAAATGTMDGVRAAVRLEEKNPSRAFESAIRGARATAEPFVRERYVELVARCGGSDALAFLLEELKSGPCRGARVAAARALHALGRGEALEEIMRTWRDHRIAPEEPTTPQRPDCPPDSVAMAEDMQDARSLQAVLDFLVSTRSAAALRCVWEAPVADETFWGPSLLTAVFVNTPVLEYTRTDQSEDGRDFESLLEDLLVRGLESPTDVKGPRDPKLRERYAEALAKRWPDRYAFDGEAVDDVREERIATMRKSWRERRTATKAPESRIRR